MSTNIILNTDSYKASHWLQYPAGTEYVSAYIESRGSASGNIDETVVFGLQPYLKNYLSTPVTHKDVDEAALFFRAHGEPFNEAGWRQVVDKHNGKLPVEVRAVHEGTVVPTRNVLVTIVNTDPEFYWLPSYLETSLLRAVWYGTTVATNSWKIKQLIRSYLEDTGDVSGLSFKLHDFGARGVSSFESAGLGGAAHLVNFMGTDTVSGVLTAMRDYNSSEVVGFSIPAAEHSTITSWGKENEAAAYENMLAQFAKPGSLVAVVSDSYDVFTAVRDIWGKQLKDKVVESGATVVIRPDSGDPVTVVTAITYLLDETFGSVINDKGYKVLNNVRIIQGDGITYETIDNILASLKQAGFSADNVAFGMGGALLQQVNRDTLKFAMKTSAVQVNGQWRDVFKDPVTDQGKRSKSGLLDLVKVNGTYTTIKAGTSDVVSELVTVFKDGALYNEQTFEDVRRRSNEG